jgi:hypothetical protein
MFAHPKLPNYQTSSSKSQPLFFSAKSSSSRLLLICTFNLGLRDRRSSTAERGRAALPPENHTAGLRAFARDLGHMNFIDVHPRIQTVFRHDVSVITDLVLYGQDSFFDGVYNVPGSMVLAADNSIARFVGYRPGTEFDGKSTGTPMFRPTMETSMPGSLSGRR